MSTSRDRAIAVGEKVTGKVWRAHSYQVLDAAHQAGHIYFEDEIETDLKMERDQWRRGYENLLEVARAVVEAAKLGQPIRDLGESIVRLSQLLDQHDKGSG